MGKMLNLINTEAMKVIDIVKDFDFKGRKTDYIELEINHKEIEKLKRNIEKDTEHVIAYTHFDRNTRQLIDMFFYIRDNDSMDPINVSLDKIEIENIKTFCLSNL